MKNYITEEYIKGFLPELSRYLWQGETNYNKQKEKAEQIVLNDFLARGYRPVLLQNELVLRENGTIINTNETGIASKEDKLSRMRLFVEVIELTGGEKKVTLQGSNDRFKWNDVVIITFTGVEIKTVITNSIYNYYRVNTSVQDGTIDFSAYLTETTYDLFFAYKWLQLVLEDAIAGENDQYMLKAKLFAKKYEELWSNNAFFSDETRSGYPKAKNSTQLKITRG
ncbi:MAG: hypothetical protein EHM58_03135 [Ignavibacteriae bacterium]|nr:MAG: hypothetical protein EHM58_03135 [Ignavibacteriota bacterium]